MIKVNIGTKKVGLDEPCLVSFEPSATYNNIESAKKMMDFVALSGADAIKFQTFTPGDSDRIMAKKNITVDFTTSSGKKQELVYEALKRRELTESEWKELVHYARKLNLIFISAPYFPETVELLSDLKIDALKVSKGDINNVLLIEQMAQTKIPIILDTREKAEDVDRAINICEKNENKKIIIMHCPSGYPSENSGVHLKAIEFLQKKYEYPIAFADHSLGGIMNYAAIALGAKMLEKTITIDKTVEHVEHFMSLELNELKTFVTNIKAIEQAMGDPIVLSKSRVDENSRRTLTAKVDIKKGQKISKDLIDFRRPGNEGISCADGFLLLNKTVKKNIPKDTFLTWDMFE